MLWVRYKTGNPSTIKILRVMGSDGSRKKGNPGRAIYHFISSLMSWLSGVTDFEVVAVLLSFLSFFF